MYLELDRFQGIVPLLLAALVVLASIGVILFLRKRQIERQLTVLREQFADAIESIPEGFVLCDAEDRLLVCNERYRRMYPGIWDLAVPGTPFVEVAQAFFQTYSIIGTENREEEALAARMAHHYHPGPPFEHELRDGRRIRITERRTRSGGTVGIHADITDVRKTQERLYHLANHDPLTGLPNRGYGQACLEQTLARARQRNSRFAVLYLDLDRFKLINDTLGHQAGDELLQAVASRLKGHLREKDLLARLGGDEFMVLLEDVDSLCAAAYAERLIDALSPPFQIEGHEVRVATSVGVAHFPDDGSDIETLMRNADAASYYAKSQGTNSYCLYTPDLAAKVFQHL